MTPNDPSSRTESSATPPARHRDALGAAAGYPAERPGERPGRDAGFDYDYARHMAAYRYGAQLVAGRRVLDAGCGDGIGSQFLAGSAAEVVGVDHSQAAVERCRRLWLDGTRSNLRFELVDLSNPGSFRERFDFVLNIQVFEHIVDSQNFLRTLRGCLAPGGRLILCTPNRLRSASENPFHVREYTAAELHDELSKVFSTIEMLGVHGNDKVERFEERRAAAVRRILRLDPLGIRNVLPRGAVEFAFAHLARLVRRQTMVPSEGEIVPDDFTVHAGNVDHAVDLLAVCSGESGAR